MKTTKEQIRKGIKGLIRDDQKSSGFFDGRFVTRINKSDKKYTRTKYKLDDE